jgi:hypothetical protein
MPIKVKTLKVEKDKTLSKITYRKRDIWWFFQWLKALVDVEKEGKTIDFNQSGKNGFGVKKLPPTKYKIKITSWQDIDLKEIKSLKPIIDMGPKELFNYLRKMFIKYKHLFGDFTLKYSKSKDELVDDPNYFIVQIPLYKNRVDIDNELSKLREIHRLPLSKKKSSISFYRAVKHNEMDKMWKVWCMKNKEYEWQGKLKTLSNYEIAKKVGYKGYRSTQTTYLSVKRMLLNIAKGEFPKNTV